MAAADYICELHIITFFLIKKNTHGCLIDVVVEFVLLGGEGGKEGRYKGTVCGRGRGYGMVWYCVEKRLSKYG